MKIKQTIFLTLGIIGSMSAAAIISQPAHAKETCGGAETAIIKCSQGDGKTVQDNGIWGLLILTLNIMTAGVGVLAVAGIVWGSVLYVSAADRAEQTKKAISIITNVVIGIVAYGLMYLILNFLIPGGIFT